MLKKKPRQTTWFWGRVLAQQRDWVWPLSIAAFTALLLLLLATGRLEWLPASLRLVLTVAALWFVPGLFVVNALLGSLSLDRLSLLPFAFCVSTSAVLIPGLAAYLGQWSLHRMILGPFALLGFAALVTLRLRQRDSSRVDVAAVKVSYTTWAAVGLAAFAGVLGWWMGLKLEGGQDVFPIIGKVLKIVSSGRVSALANAYTPTTAPDVNTGFNGWQLVLALTSQLSGVEPMLVYSWTVPLLAFLKVLSMYVLGSLVFRDQSLGLATAGAFFLDMGLHSNAGVNMYTAYPNSIGWFIFLPVVTGLVFAAIRDPRKNMGPLLLAVALAWPMVAVHKVHPLKLWLGFGAFAVLSAAVGTRERRWSLALRTALLLFFMVLMSLPHYIVESTQTIRSSEPVLQSLVLSNVIPLARGFYVADFPLDTLAIGLTVLLLPFFWSRMAKDDWAIYIVACTIAPFLLLYNPIVYPLLVRVLYLAAPRFWQLIPTHLALGYLLWMAWKWTGSLAGSGASRWIPSPRPVLILTLLLVALLGPRAALLGKHVFHLSRYRIDQPGAAIDLVRQNVPTGATVLSDSATSERLPAYASVYTVVWPLGQAGTGADYGDRRQADMQLMFQPGTPLEEVRRLLNQYGVNYILFNEAEAVLSGLADEAYASRPDLFPVVAERMVEQKISLPSLREEILSQRENDKTQWRVTLYQVKR
jgi:hypothetical protein